MKQSISFPLQQLEALRRAAAEDGHGYVSRIVQDLVEQEMRRRYGRDWAKGLADERETAAVA